MNNQIENYRQILQQTVNRHAQFQPANGQIETRAVCDRETNEFLVVDSGWNEKGRRIYDVILHFRLQDGTVYVERDNTDAEVVRDLLEAGIEKDNIILAYNSLPYQRLDDLVLV
ncbi:MAG TPA: element excision factor XisI family protein [Pyrinomonadaceae bacterium]|nr:element excision factor XisI family protein [Pyrinomonadaceae bacterium]